jgi:hypothetical protein
VSSKTEYESAKKDFCGALSAETFEVFAGESEPTSAK